MAQPSDPPTLPLENILVGARVQRVDMPSPALLALSLDRCGSTAKPVLLLGWSPSARGVGWVARRPHGAPADAFVQRLRKLMEGARISGVQQPEPAVLALLFTRGARVVALHVHMHGHRGNLRLHTADGELALHQAPARSHAEEGPAAVRAATHPRTLPDSLDALAKEGARLLNEQASAALNQRRQTVLAQLTQRRRQLARRVRAIQADLERADQAATLRSQATSLLAQLHTLDNRVREVALTDASGERVSVPIDPRLGLRGQIDAWFKRARGLERAAAIGKKRLEEASATQAWLSDVEQRVREAADAATLHEIYSALEPAIGAAPTGGIPKTIIEATQRPSGQRASRTPYRVFSGSGGRAILVGRSARDNDLLTTRHARPHDLWLHVRDGAGSHVVVPLSKDEDCPQELLLDAATLAVHYSDERASERSDVIYVARRYVRKPRNSPAGAVLPQREKVLRLRLERDRLERLLAEPKAPDRQSTVPPHRE